MDDLVAVRRLIAAAVLQTDEATDARRDQSSSPDTALRAHSHAGNTLGTIHLHPHQQDAVCRLLPALQQYGGALLADAPGLGKTFTALAVARQFGGAIVLCPATLRAQWQRAAQQADVQITVISVERLSRGAPNLEPSATPRDRPALVIIDEAHHLRNPRTHRYAHAAALTIGRRVLLLSATPVHNRTDDRDALLALFLGTRPMTDADLTALIVHRDAGSASLPRVRAARWLAPPSHPSLTHTLRTLPPPLPAADGRAAAALIRLVLAHSWSSSLAALDSTLRHLQLRACAIDDALAAGRWPTRRELRDWLAVGDGTQLSFVELTASAAVAPLDTARATLRRFRDATIALRERIVERRELDATARASLLRRIVHAHPAATVVAFSRYAATIEALWRALRTEVGVVALTARGVRSAGGGLSRAEVLARLASRDGQHRQAPLRLVLSTDLLGEGLDLLAASVIVHLDQAWTPARMAQREGRAARLGSVHTHVSVYAVRPPAGAARVLALADRLQRKRTAMHAGVAPGAQREQLIALARSWSLPTLHEPNGTGARRGPPRIAAVRAASDGWIAVVADASGRWRLVAGDGTGASDDDGVVLRLLRAVGDWRASIVPNHRARAARRLLQAWLTREAAIALTEQAAGAPHARAVIRQRLDAMLRATPLHQRRASQQEYADLTSLLATLRGAGAERALEAASRMESYDAMRDTILALRGNSAGEGPAPRRSRVLALLILVAAAGDAPHDQAPSRP